MAGVLAYDKREPGSGRNVLLPPWLKMVAVLEELGEAHTARSEDDRLDAPALRAISHRQGRTHHPRTLGHSGDPRLAAT